MATAQVSGQTEEAKSHSQPVPAPLSLRSVVSLPEGVKIEEEGVEFIQYTGEHLLPRITSLIARDLSEPYSIFTYRYFLNQWPFVSFLALKGDETVGVIVSRLENHQGSAGVANRGYIAMLAVDIPFRKKGIATALVQLSIESMIRNNCDEVMLETEASNKGALALYQNLGFVRDKRLNRYYLNGGDAFRLKLWLH